MYALLNHKKIGELRMVKYDISEEQILKFMKSTKDVREYRRWQVIHLVQIQKMKKTHAAKAIGISKVSLHGILNRFASFGPEGMPTKPRGGRLDSYMSLDEEKQLIDGLFENGEKGLIITAREVKEAAEKKLQHAVSEDYAYDLLHRQGWRKVTPRPKHPKNNKEQQEEFKKKFHSWSKHV